MTEDQFLSRHSATWRELETTCQKINKQGMKSLTTSEIKRYLTLFKLTSHHLAYAKTHYTGSQSIAYLNTLVTTCNTNVYTTQKPKLTSSFPSLITTYSNILKKYRTYILFSFGLFLFGGLLSFLLVYFKPEYAGLFMDQELIDSITQNGSSSSTGSWNYPLMSSYIMINNITVSLKAFIFGVTLGLGTAYILYKNGLLLGSLTAMFYLYGDPIHYWSLILPHGVIELTAIFISGAAGFILAKSLLIPGKLTRKASVIQGSHNALGLMGGVVIFLIIAGLIEGFFTPLAISVTAKLLFALLTAVLLLLLILRAYTTPKEDSKR